MHKKIMLLSMSAISILFATGLTEEIAEAPRASTDESIATILTHKVSLDLDMFCVREELTQLFNEFEEALDKQKSPFIVATVSNAGGMMTTERNFFLPTEKKKTISRLLKSCLVHGGFRGDIQNSNESFPNKADKFINNKLIQLSSINYTASILLLIHEEGENLACLTFESKYNQTINSVSEIEILMVMINDWSIENNFKAVNHKTSCRGFFCRPPA